MNKSKTGSSREQHHSGPTSTNIPDTAAASDKGAPEQKEMWSIFSIYPETMSQCIGRKLKELRLEAASIALHDHVELEVKERIAEEERAEQDTLIIDNEEERLIREEVKNDIKEDSEISRKPGRKSTVVRGVKSKVTLPDIRSWLEQRSSLKRKEAGSAKQTPVEVINVGQVVMSSNSGSADSQPKEKSPVLQKSPIIISGEESSAVTVNQKPTAVLNSPDTIVIS